MVEPTGIWAPLDHLSDQGVPTALLSASHAPLPGPGAVVCAQAG
jgi:hypothetical protein